MEEFTDAVVFGVGGWNPRFDRVVAKAVVGTEAAAIIESNGVDSEVTGETVTVSFNGKDHKVEMEPSGFWLFAARFADFADASADWEDLPRRIS